MKSIETFSTQRNLLSKLHISAQLWADGHFTGKRVPGYDIRAQYQIDDRYLLITDCDCPFEETTYFILLDSQFRRLATRQRRIFAMDFRPLGENQVSMRSGGPYELTVTVHRQKLGLFSGLLTLKEKKEGNGRGGCQSR